MEETNEMEFKKQFEEFMKKLGDHVNKLAKELEAEKRATQVLEGENGRYLIHLN